MSGNGIRCLAYVAARVGLGRLRARARGRHCGRTPRRGARPRPRERRSRRGRGRHGCGSRSRRATDVTVTRARHRVPRRRRGHRQPALRVLRRRSRRASVGHDARADHRAQRPVSTSVRQRRVRSRRRTRHAGDAGVGARRGGDAVLSAPARARRPRSRPARARQRTSRCACPGGELAIACSAPLCGSGDRSYTFSIWTSRSRDHVVAVAYQSSAPAPPPPRPTSGRVRQRALIVGTTTDESLDELALLADTAGADVVHRELQKRPVPDPATYIGKGKAAEMQEISTALDIDVVIFDDELTPAQQRNLENAVRGRRRRPRRADPRHLRPARDEPRGQAAGRARAAAVPAAAPARRGLQLSQQGRASAPAVPARPSSKSTGGDLLRRMQTARARPQRPRRRRAHAARRAGAATCRTVALVGYTNAGKSTLLNRLTHAGVLVENQLFATLDPTTRRLRLPGGETVLLSDTVGFVRRLPHQLVEAFRSTLEEVVDADLLVHVVDASAPDADGRIAAVDTVLREIDADEVPRLLVWNKADLADPDELDDPCSQTHAGRSRCRRRPATGSRNCSPRSATALRALAPVSSSARSLRPRRRARRAAPRGRGARRSPRRQRHAGAGAAPRPRTAVSRSSRPPPISLGRHGRMPSSYRRRTRTNGSTRSSGSPTLARRRRRLLDRYAV